MPERPLNEVDWDAIYWEQMPRLYNFFRYRTGNRQLAEDLTSQTLLRAWKHRHTYRADLGAFEAWLFQIARNLAVDSFRRQRPATVPLDDAFWLASAVSVEAEAQKRHNATRLYQLLSTLPDQDQELIALKFGADLTNRAIAGVLGLSESNVGTKLHRIIRKLRAEWEVNHATPR